MVLSGRALMWCRAHMDSEMRFILEQHSGYDCHGYKITKSQYRPSTINRVKKCPKTYLLTGQYVVFIFAV